MKTKLIFSAAALLIITSVIVSCKKEIPAASAQEAYSATPVLPDVADNYQSSANKNLAALGRVLFYDKNLSLNSSVACASCHQQAKAFCDNLQFSVGLENGRTSRNAPSIFAKTGRVFWDGRASSLTDLALKPVQNHVEMGFTNLADLEKKITNVSYYSSLFGKAYNGNTSISQGKIKEALSEFLKNFNFSNNKFRRSEQGQDALNATETLGKSLFFGKAKCSGCHHIESNNFFVSPGDSTVIVNGGGGGNGGYGNTEESHNIGLDEVYSDNGIGTLDNDRSMDGQFMIPVLLNIEYTSPYMHDGRYKTLEEVVEHYNSGIKNHPNLDLRLRDIGFDLDNMTIQQEQQVLAKFDKNHNGDLEPSEISAIPPVKLGLSTGEKKALVEFLKTLSDPTIFTEKKFSNPFALK